MKKALFGIIAIAALIFTTAPPAIAEAPPGQEETVILAQKIIATTLVGEVAVATQTIDSVDRPIRLKDDPTDRPYLDFAIMSQDNDA